MTVLTKVQRAACTIRLISDDAILADFLAASPLPEGHWRIEPIALRAASGRLRSAQAPDAIVMDRPGFETLEPALADLPAGLPRILVADRIDAPTVRRLLAAGGTAAIPTSFEKPLFLRALALALAGEVFLPSALWLPCLEERLVVAQPGQSGDPGLTPRERDVLCELATGKSNKLIAHSLGIAEPTVKMHLARIGRKFGVANRTQLLTRAIRQGLLPDLSARAALPG